MKGNFLKDIDFEIFKKSVDKPVILGLRVIDCVRLCSLLCDVSMGLLPSVHLQEKRVNYYKELAKELNDVVCGVCKNGEKK